MTNLFPFPHSDQYPWSVLISSSAVLLLSSINCSFLCWALYLILRVEMLISGVKNMQNWCILHRGLWAILLKVKSSVKHYRAFSCILPGLDIKNMPYLGFNICLHALKKSLSFTVSFTMKFFYHGGVIGHKGSLNSFLWWWKW